MHKTKQLFLMCSALAFLLSGNLVWGQSRPIPGNPLGLFTDASPFSDLSFLGAGARARAMGGAFYAVSDDPSALTWNPAGLTQMDKAQMALSLHHTRASNDYSGQYSSTTPGSPFAGDIGQSVDQLAFFGVVFPFQLKGRDFVGSVSVPNAVSEIRAIDFRDNIAANQEINGRLASAALGVATRLWKQVTFGLAVNIYGHGYDRNSWTKYEISPAPDETVFINHPKLKGSFSGWNLTAGGMLKMNKVRLAIVFKSPFTESNPLKEDQDVQLLTDIIINGVVNPPQGRAAGILYKTKREWILPGILGLGASIQPSQNLLIAADFDYKPFSKAWARRQVDILDPRSEFEPVELNWFNINQFRIGAEYKLKVNRFIVPIRAGFRNDPKVWDNADTYQTLILNDGNSLYLTPGRGSQAKGSVVSLGTGVAFGQVAFDFTWEFGSYDYTENGLLETKDSDVIVGNSQLLPFSRTSSISNNRVILNFTGVF